LKVAKNVQKNMERASPVCISLELLQGSRFKELCCGAVEEATNILFYKKIIKTID
jgi:hypothetical protein